MVLDLIMHIRHYTSVLVGSSGDQLFETEPYAVHCTRARALLTSAPPTNAAAVAFPRKVKSLRAVGMEAVGGRYVHWHE